MKIDCTSNNGKPCLNCEAFMAGFSAARAEAQAMHRRAQKAESAIRAVERRAEGICRDAEARIAEQHRIRGLYRQKMRDAAALIRASCLIQTETPANPETGMPRIVEGRLDVLVPALIAECKRLWAEVARLSDRASYDGAIKVEG